jgi:hypothetical protein
MPNFKPPSFVFVNCFPFMIAPRAASTLRLAINDNDYITPVKLSFN